MISRWRLPAPRRQLWRLVASAASLLLAAAVLLRQAAAGGWLSPTAALTALALVALVLFIAVTWWIDRRLAHPAVGIARAARTRRHNPAGERAPAPPRSWLADLPAAVDDLADALATSEVELNKAAASWAGELQRQRAWLRALLDHTEEGLVICDEHGSVVTYNKAARAALDDPPALGRGRRLDELLEDEPVAAALSRIRDSAGSDAGFRTCTHPGGTPLMGRVAPLPVEAGGRLIVLNEWHGSEQGPDDERLAGLRASASIRRLAARLRAASERSARTTTGDDATAALRDSADALVDALPALTGATEASAAPNRRYPRHAVREILTAVESRVDGVTLAPTGEGDRRVHAAVTPLANALATLPAAFGVEAMRLGTGGGGDWVHVSLVLEPEGEPRRYLQRWLGMRVADGGESLSHAELVAAHAGDLRCEVAGRTVTLTLALPASDSATPGAPATVTAAFARRRAPRATRPVTALDYVVFDTETTGLEPSQGDEIIAIGAVRVSGTTPRRDEVFDCLVNPGRRIPPESSRFHGIDDRMVQGAPDVATAVRAFHEFAGNAVLVAHNAAFDMRFLHRAEAGAGVTFANPVLDTLLLSLLVHDHAREHTLEAIARRVGVEVTGRHTALGDALTTAMIFSRLLPLLPTRGLTTLGDVERASTSLVEYRRQQRAF